MKVSGIETYLDCLCKIFQKLLVSYQDLTLLFGSVDLGEDEIIDDVLGYSDDLIGVPALRISEKSQIFRENLSLDLW